MTFETIAYRAPDGVGLQGLLLRRPGDLGRAGVVLFGDMMGVGDHIRRQAERIASLGYSAFVGDFYGGGVRFADPAAAFPARASLQQDPIRLRARGQAALAAFVASGAVDPQRVSAAGYCFGGQIVLEMVRDRAPLAAAMSFHGDLTPLGGPMAGGATCVMSYTGSADPLIPRAQVEAFRAEVEAAGVPWQISVHGGVGHSFTDPGADAFGIVGVGYSREADLQSFAQMRELLDQRLGA